MRKSKIIEFNGKIDKIYHIADVHIRNLKRHAEYREVFERLYQQIADTKTDSSIIIVAGDVVHAKTDMTPEVVEMTQTFLKRLSDLLPTILIPGNHDANLNNPSRLDALSPIVNALNHPHLHYLRDSGVWKMGGISFSHSSIFGDNKSIIPATDVSGDFKVALYHGPVDKVKTEYGFVIENKHVNVDSFDGYDLVVLGDLHVPNQQLRPDGTMKYVGSTIMQNHSEAKHPDHGMLVWDIPTKTSTFVPIHNDYSYVTIEVENGVVLNNPYISDKPRMRVRVKDTTQADLKKILSKIRVGRKVQEVSIQKVITDKKGITGNTSIVLQNVRDIGFQNKLIETFLLDRFVLGDDQLEIIRNINAETNANLKPLTGLKNIIWKPKKFEFSNMFSYGKDNVIDFTNMKGAYGMFAPNASGKSSVWDALSFCIFDKCSRTSKAIDVLNNSKSSFDCKFNFEIEGVDYFIEKMGKKSPKRGTVKVDIDFYRINEDGSRESLNGDERRETTANIRQYVGSYEDFTLTAMSNQSNNSGFIEKSQKERKDLLTQFLDMSVFEELYQIATEEVKGLNGLLKDYKNQNFTEKLSDAEDSLIRHKDVLTGIKSKLETQKEQKTEIVNVIEELRRTLKPVDNTIADIEVLNKRKETIEASIAAKNIECMGYSDGINNTLNKIGELQSELDKYDLNELQKSYQQYQYFTEQKTQIETKLKNLKISLKHKQEHLDGIGSLSFDDGCAHCVANKNTPFARQSETLSKEIDNLNIEKSHNEITYDGICMELPKYNVIDKLQIVSELKSNIKEAQTQLGIIKTKASNCDIESANLEVSLGMVIELITKAENQKDAVYFNREIETKIEINKDDLADIEDLISETNDELIDVNGDIRIAENTIKTINDSIARLEQMEKKYEGYEYYIQCVKRDGVPYELITDILPKLEIEINNILQPIVDFQILFNTDGKNINSYIAYGDEQFWPLELTSGMEKFISSIAIRTALINISNLPRPNFIAIDEGFGSLDSDNFNSLYLLFDYLKNEFDFIVTISHIDKTRDMVDQIIDITKLGGFSSIRYL